MKEELFIDPKLFGETTFQPSSPSLTFVGEGTSLDPMVTITNDGEVKFGSTYHPDEAAKGFWNAMGMHHPSRKLVDENARLRAAIKPFADAALDLDPGDHGSIWEHHAAMDIDCDDLRNCQRLLDSSNATLERK